MTIRIEELQKQRVAITEKVKQLADKEASGEQLSDEEAEAFSQLKVEFDQIGAQIDRAKEAEAMAASVATPVDTPAGSSPAVHAKKTPEDYPGAKAARFAMSIAAGKGDMNLAHKFAADEIGDKDVAMAISTASGSGGALIPEHMANEIIELLRPKSIVRALGARPVPLVNGKVTIPRMAGGATSSYKGENKAQRAESASTDDVKLLAKTQMSIVPISNELIGYAGFNVEQLFLDDMTTAIGKRQDKAWLRDDGTNDTPIGFRKVAMDAGRTQAWSGDPTLADIDVYLDSLILGLMDSDSNMTTPGWGLSPRSFIKLSGLRDGNGNKVYPEMAKGLLKGYPFKHTTNIPVNLGTGANESEIYFADWADVLIGETGEMTIDFSKEATYVDETGTLVSAFSNNQSVLRVVTANDVGFRHLEGLQLGTGVTW